MKRIFPRLNDKRLWALLLAGALLLSLCACGEQKSVVPAAAVSQIAPVAVEREPEPRAAQAAGEAMALALRQYIYARLVTETLASADVQTMSADEIKQMADEVVLAWETAGQLATGAEAIADQAVALLEDATIKQTAAFDRQPAQIITLAANAARFHVAPLANNVGRKIDPQTWAENLTKQFDALKGAQRYKQLASQLGTDAKTAYEQMALAQKIITDAAALEEARAEADEVTRCLKLVQGYKTVSKVGLFVAATIQTGGGTLTALPGSSFTLAQAAGTIVGGTDCIVDIADTGSNIILGEGNQVSATAEDVKKYLGPVSSVMGIVNWGDAAGGEKLSYVGDALTDWFYEGKVMGVQVFASKDGGTELTAQVFENLGEAGLKASLEAAGYLFPQTSKTLLEIINGWKPNPKAAIARLDALTAQMEAFNPAAQAPDVAQPTPAPAVDVSGKYAGTSTATSYDASGNVIETKAPGEFSFVIRAEGGKIFFNRVGYEDSVFELSYDSQTGVASFEKNGGTMEFVFDLSASPVTAKAT
ncbi:MAG: hypothetical protein LLF87_09550, partial [Eubacteriales bacterium]|nr:hypothetical protein [Eubacteriales bacterium]